MKTIDQVLTDERLLEIGRKAVEDQLVSLRDSRLSVLFGGNGLVIRERDGGESAIIRMSVKQALVTALRAISEAGEL